MRVFCAGFNLYGQFLNIYDKCVENFTCTIYKNAIDLQISHTYSILKIQENDCNNILKRSKIKLHGFLKNKINQNEELNFDFDNIVQISVSNSHALFLSKEGKIFRLEYKDSSGYDLRLLPDVIATDQNETETRTDYIIKIANGTLLSTGYSNLGFMYKFPSRIDSETLHVKYMCTGREHCLILTDDGLLYSFGGGSRGQLGHGDVEDIDVPEQIKSLGGVKIVKIACGAWHSIALSEDGDIYTWGWNSNGQLGLGIKFDQITVMASSQVIEFDENIIDICCGSRHTIILTESSKLYGCGWNKYCQLGFRSADENNFEFKLLYDFIDFNVIGLRCGTWNTSVLVSD